MAKSYAGAWPCERDEFEMNKILINQGFPLQHSDEAEAEAARIPENISTGN